MKNKLILISMIVFILLSSSSCSSNKTKTPTDKTANLNIIYDDNAEDIAVFSEDNNFKENGVLYIESVYPVFKMSEKYVKQSSTLHQNVNDYNKEIRQKAIQFVEENKEYVKSEFKKRDIKPEDGHFLYKVDGSIIRKDNKILSLMTKIESDTMVGLKKTIYDYKNFDALTGKILKIEDLVKDVNILENMINDYLASINNKNNLVLFDDYKNIVHNMITDTNREDFMGKFQFYITDKSLNIVFNPNDVAPSNTRIIDYQIPYDKYSDLLTKRYFK